MPDVSQQALINQLVKFLKSSQPAVDKKTSSQSEAKQLQERKQFIDDLSRDLNAHGYCYGFAICRGVMVMLGKRQWWDSLKLAIATWDGDLKKLDERSVLPGTKNERSLRENFELFLNFIVSTYGLPNKSFEPFVLAGITQTNFMSHEFVRYQGAESKHKSLEVLNEKGELLTVQRNVKIVGNFTVSQAAKLLNRDQLKGNLCVVSSYAGMHTLEFDFEDDHPNVYDPVYKDQKLKDFKKPDEAIGEVLLRLNPRKKNLTEDTLIISLASFSPFDFDLKYYEELLAKQPFDIAKGDALATMIYNVPERIPKLLQSFYDAKRADGPDLVVDMLKASINPITGHPALIVVAQAFPDELPELMRYASQSKKYNQAVLDIFYKDGASRLGAFIYNAPNCLPALLQIFKNSKDNMLPLLLLEKGGNNKTNFQLIAERAPSCLNEAQQFITDSFLNEGVCRYPQVIDWIAEAKGGPENLLARLKSAQKLPSDVAMNGMLERVLDHVEKSKSWPEEACKLLLQTNKLGRTQLQELAMYSKPGLVRVLNAVAMTPAGARTILSALSAQDNTGTSGRQALKLESPDIIKNVVNAFAMSLKQLDNDALTALTDELTAAAAKPKRGKEFKGLFKKSAWHSIFKSYAANTLSAQLVTACQTEMSSRHLSDKKRSL